MMHFFPKILLLKVCNCYSLIMAIITQTTRSQTVESPEKLAHKRLTAERMQDVRLLLQNLVNSEEETVKLVLDCLYDIGAVNLIDQKFRARYLNKTMKVIARMSKPIFKIFAWQWLKKNSPQLIANWLQTQVAFVAPIAKPQQVVIKEVEPYYSLQTDRLKQEVRLLRHQVKWLTAIAVIALSVSGITVIKLNHNQLTPLQSKHPIPLKTLN